MPHTQLRCPLDLSRSATQSWSFMKKWESRDLGPATSSLNIQIKCEGCKILIDQCSYLEKVLEHFGMQNAKITPTPLPQDYYPSKHFGSVDPEL